MTKLIFGNIASIVVGTIHWIKELTPILEFGTIVLGFLGVLGTTILIWKKILITNKNKK